MTGKQKETIKWIATTALLLAAMVCMAAVLYAFSVSLHQNQMELGRERLREITVRNVAFLKLLVEDRTDYMAAVAGEVALVEDLQSPEVVALLARFCSNADFARMAIDFPDGLSLTSDGYKLDVSHMNHLKQMMEGKPFVTQLQITIIDHKPSVSILYPIIRGGKVVAGVRGTLYTQTLGQAVDVGFFGGQGYFHLMNSQGEYLAVPDTPNALMMGGNFYDTLDSLAFDAGYSAQQIRADMAMRQGGSTAYSLGEEQRYAEYMPVGVNDWYLMVLAPKWIIDKNAGIIRQQVLLMILQISGIALLVFFFVLFFIWRSRNKTRQMNDRLMVEEKRYRFMLERSNNIIFEYNLMTGILQCSEKFLETFGYEPVCEGLPESALTSGQVHPDDGEALYSTFGKLTTGTASSKTEMRIRNSDGAYVWCAIAIVPILGESGEPVAVLGVIENVDEQKQREQALILKAEKDQLTGAYNKTTSQRLVQSFLHHEEEPGTCHALMMLDMDNFKLVNDRLGHARGDQVLSDLADCLRAVLRENDIVGRVGGDEFLVFMKNIHAGTVAQLKAEEICARMSRVYNEGDVDCPVAVSIGVALYPQHGQDFDTLYRNADQALYSVKNAGKDGWMFYNPENPKNAVDLADPM